MRARQLTRWQKASALVPMTLLVGAWGAALTNSGLATAGEDNSLGDIPDVPATAFEQPASVQQTPGIDPRAGAAGALSTLSTNGIPSAALYAYRRAETLLSKADQDCKLPWNLVAAIGRVESNHGRSNGNALSADGLAQPGIYGVALDGRNGRTKISDTDDGKLDKDTVYDRAVGPMQFIPGTWSTVGVDSDNDGKKNPQDIDDAATAAGIYLCAGSDDLSSDKGARSAVKRYNHSDSYVDLVMQISAAYAAGDFSQSPNGYSTASVITSQSYDQTLTPKERAKAKDREDKANKPGGSTDGGSSGGSTGGSGGSTSGGTGPIGGGGGGTGGSTGTTTLGGTLQDGLDDSPLGTVTRPVTQLLTMAEANTRCLIEVALLPLNTHTSRFNTCIAKYTK